MGFPIEKREVSDSNENIGSDSSKFDGCFALMPNLLSYNKGFLFNNEMSIDICRKFCHTHFYSWLKKGLECTCSDTLEDLHRIDSNSCNVKCHGNNKQMCGSNEENIFSIYKTMIDETQKIFIRSDQEPTSNRTLINYLYSTVNSRIDSSLKVETYKLLNSTTSIAIQNSTLLILNNNKTLETMHKSETLNFSVNENKIEKLLVLANLILWILIFLILIFVISIVINNLNFIRDLFSKFTFKSLLIKLNVCLKNALTHDSSSDNEYKLEILRISNQFSKNIVSNEF